MIRQQKYQGDKLRLVRIRKLFLAIGFCLLVASIFSPFATDFYHLLINWNPGPYLGPPRAGRVTFWSFMHIQEGLSKINGTWVVTNVQWLSFAQYWDWWGPGGGTILPSTILIPTFILQIVAVGLGLITLLKANTAKKLFPALIIMLTLNFLYFALSIMFNSEVFIGFWLSILSTASIIVAYKFVDGTEGANITVTSVDAERGVHGMYLFTNLDLTKAPEVSLGNFGNSTSPLPDALSPSGGEQDRMWMVLCAFEKDVETVTAFPTNYTSSLSVSQFSGATIGAAVRQKTAATEEPGVFTISGAEEWQAFTIGIHPIPAATAVLTGTVTASIEENDILDGGKTIILTLTGDTWVAAGAPFNAIRQDIIDGMVSAQISGTGFRLWNDEVTPNEVVGAVVRTSDTVVTITLTASPLYNIFIVDPALTQETITVTIPASALEDTTIPVVAATDFTVDQSPVSVEITGTMDGSDETDIVAGGRTMLLTLRQDNFTSMWGSTQAQLIIDGLNSAQSELTGWNNEVRDKMPVTDVVRTGNQLLTITFSAQAGYDITAPEVITATIPGSVLDGTPPDFDATPDINIAVGPAAADLSGTITPASTEAQIVAGGRTLLITLDNDTWVASGAAFNGVRQAIIDGITSAQAEVLGWNNEVRDNLPVGQVVRTSDTVVTVSFVPETAYNIVDFEEITVTVPAAALLGSGVPVVATPTFVIFEVPVALVTGTAVPEVDEVDVVAGGETIILTLIDDEWVAAGAIFNAVRQAIIDGLDSAGSELLGWNNEVRDNLPVTAVVRTSATVVTITLTAQAGYDIAQTETITVTVPGAALDQTPNDITGVPTFSVIKESGSHMRDRRGGKHAEDVFDVNEPDVATFEVNKFE